MTLLELLERRRSCRKFRPDGVPQSLVDQIIKGVMTAPSSKNTRTTRLVVVRDRAIIEKLAATRTYGSSWMKDAPLAVIVAADVQAGGLWVENCAISAIILQLMAESLGLGSCWVHVNARPHDDALPEETTAEEYIHSLLPATAGWHIECMVALGFPAEEPHPRKERDDSDKVMVIG